MEHVRITFQNVGKEILSFSLPSIPHYAIGQEVVLTVSNFKNQDLNFGPQKYKIDAVEQRISSVTDLRQTTHINIIISVIEYES